MIARVVVGSRSEHRLTSSSGNQITVGVGFWFIGRYVQCAADGLICLLDFLGILQIPNRKLEILVFLT